MSDILVFENYFLILIAIIWIIIAIIQDFRKREVANWWNFSLVIVALAYRAFLAVAKGNHWYFSWGVIGFCMGLVIANLFYYIRLFAGGDAKLLIGLGVILPLSLNWIANLQILSGFFIIFLLAGGAYGGIYSLVLTFMNYKKVKQGFYKQFDKNKYLVSFISIASVIIFAVSWILNIWLILWFSILVFVTPWLLIYARSVEENCFLRYVKTKDLTIGDWLAKDVKVGKKKIKPDWQGLDEKELKLIQRKYKGKVLIKYGIPFTPVFLLAFIGMLILNTLTTF